MEQLLAVLDALEAEPLKWRALVHVLIDTGIHRGECRGLRWEDIDLENQAATITLQNAAYTSIHRRAGIEVREVV